MRLRIIFFLAFGFLFLAGNQSICQESRRGLLRATIAPLNLFDPVSGVVQLGVQKRVSNRIAIAVDYGHRFNILSVGYQNSERNEYKYFKGKAEVKYFVQSSKPVRRSATRRYFSFQVFYFPQQYRKEKGWIIRDTTYQYTSSNIDRKALTISVLKGKEIIKGRFTLDSYIGIGYRILIIRHQTRGETAQYKPQPIEWSPPIADEKEGTFSRPHLALGIKIGYDF